MHEVQEIRLASAHVSDCTEHNETISVAFRQPSVSQLEMFESLFEGFLEGTATELGERDAARLPFTDRTHLADVADSFVDI